MSRDTNPSCKRCRRSGVKLFLKGTRCETAKCAIDKRNFPPGPRVNRYKKISEYGRRLRAKQNMRFFYGVTETFIRNAYKKTSRQKGIAGYNLLLLFEGRLDNIITRSRLVFSRKEARQLVMHGHFELNSKSVDRPSIQLKVGDKITFKKSMKECLETRYDRVNEEGFPNWLSFDQDKAELTVTNVPTREEIMVPAGVEEQLVIEYYSK
jgi:small subunit ribosomal protein S4